MTTDHQRDLPPEVVEYIEAIPPEHRRVFDELHRLVLDTLPDARVTLSYKMPAYVTEGGRVSLSSGTHGISIATTVAEPVAAFRAKHRGLKTGKISVLFPPDAVLPVDDLTTLIIAATARSA